MADSNFPGGSEGKESACYAGDSGLITGSGRSPGKVNGNPLQCSCLENLSVHGVPESDMTEQLSMHAWLIYKPLPKLSVVKPWPFYYGP